MESKRAILAVIADSKIEVSVYCPNGMTAIVVNAGTKTTNGANSNKTLGAEVAKG